jgi:hypothetical protein
MSDEERTKLVDYLSEVYAEEVLNPSCPLNQTCTLGAPNESRAALVWVAVSVLRWVRTRKGRQFVKIHGVSRWWEPERTGLVLLALSGDTKCDSYMVEVSPNGQRGLNLVILTAPGTSLHGTCGTDARPVWSERATVYADAGGEDRGMWLEPVLKSAKLHSGKRR